MPLVSIVVPVYHNAASLPPLLEKFQDLARRNPGDQFEFLFVDDGSKDTSWQVLNALRLEEPRMRLLKLSRNFGSNAAILAGIDRAAGDVVAVIAADLQDPPELIHDMLGHWREGKKVVLAARGKRDDPGLTSLFADGFYWLFRKFAIATMPRRGFDFFLLDRQVCGLIRGIQEANPYIMGLILWLGFDPFVLEYNRKEREQRFGRSMWTFTRKIKYFIDSFAAFSYSPIRAASLLGLLLSATGVCYTAIIVLLWMFSSVTIPGWSSLMIVILLTSGFQFVMMGILGEYLWRNLDETRHRPRFIVEKEVSGDSGSDRLAA